MQSSSSGSTESKGFSIDSLSTGVDKANGLYHAANQEKPDLFQFAPNEKQNATVGVTQACPNRTQDVILGEYCTLRYSSTSFIGSMITRPRIILRNLDSPTRLEEFMSDLRILLNNISIQASNGGSLRKVGYGSRPTAGLLTIYALGQCTPDLSIDGCFSCLNAGAQELPGPSRSSIGMRMNFPSCYLHYEINRFYHETRLHELSLPMPMPPRPGRETGNNTTRTIIIVVSTVAVVIVTLIGVLIWRRNHEKPKDGTAVEEADEISVIESLHYDFSMIQDAIQRQIS